MKTTIELPDDLFRRAKARAALQGRSLKEMVAEGLILLMKTQGKSDALLRLPVRKRGSAGEWGKRFAGIAKLAPDETTEEARMDHYRQKYNI